MYASKYLNGFKSWVLIFIGLLFILVILPFFFWNTSLAILYIDILKPILSLFLAGLIIYTAWWAYKFSRDVFNPWFLLSMGLVLYFIANLLYFIFEDIMGITPSTSIADAIYLAVYPLLIGGIFLFLKKPFKTRFKAFLDAVIVMVSAFFIVWFLFIWPTVGPSQPDTLSVIISIAYLFLDLILLFVVLTVLFNENRKISALPLILLTLGMFFQIFGDMIYAYYVPNPSLVYKWLFNVFYILDIILIALAIISYLWKVNIDIGHLLSFYKRSRAQNDWISYLPLILVLFTYSLLIVTTPDEALIWGVGIVVTLVILREIISLNEIRKAQITLKRNKELISKRKEQLTFITSNMLDIITETDENGKYKYVSPSSNQLLGYSPEYLLGKSFYDFIHPDNLKEVNKILKKPVVSSTNVRLQYQCKNAEGKYIWLETIGKPVLEDGGGKGFIYSSRDISEQKRSEELIKKSLREKEILLKEIHHRVNNNLQIISSLLSLQSRNVVNKEDYKLFVESQNRVMAMAMIHEMLYQSEDLNHINFSNYIRDLVSNLFYSYGIKNRISPIINVGPVSLNIETAIPCGLIISELVSNSLKYAYPDNAVGKVSISLKSLKNELELIVSDDGVGFPEEMDFNKTESSLGLKLVNSLIKQLDGSIELDRSQGTKFTIKFKELTYKQRI